MVPVNIKFFEKFSFSSSILSLIAAIDSYSMEDEEGNGGEMDIGSKLELANDDGDEGTIQPKSAVSQLDEDEQLSEEREPTMEALETLQKFEPIYDDAVEDDAVEDVQMNVANFVNGDDHRRILTDDY